MLAFLSANLSTIIILLVVILCAGLAARKIIRDKKSGSCCGCSKGCTGCSGCGAVRSSHSGSSGHTHSLK